MRGRRRSRERTTRPAGVHVVSRAAVPAQAEAAQAPRPRRPAAQAVPAQAEAAQAPRPRRPAAQAVPAQAQAAQAPRPRRPAAQAVPAQAQAAQAPRPRRPAARAVPAQAQAAQAPRPRLRRRALHAPAPSKPPPRWRARSKWLRRWCRCERRIRDDDPRRVRGLEPRQRRGCVTSLLSGRELSLDACLAIPFDRQHRLGSDARFLAQHDRLAARLQLRSTDRAPRFAAVEQNAQTGRTTQCLHSRAPLP